MATEHVCIYNVIWRYTCTHHTMINCPYIYISKILYVECISDSSFCRHLCIEPRIAYDTATFIRNHKTYTAIITYISTIWNNLNPFIYRLNFSTQTILWSQSTTMNVTGHWWYSYIHNNKKSNDIVNVVTVVCFIGTGHRCTMQADEVLWLVQATTLPILRSFTVSILFTWHINMYHIIVVF